MSDFLTVDGKQVPIAGERNLLEVCRKAGVNIPTFCYHSTLSIYGACRLCLVDVEKMGVLPSCSTPPAPGMVVRTHTEELQEMRKVVVELLLASHDMQCPTCQANTRCELQALAKRLRIDKVRFKQFVPAQKKDDTNPSVVRDPSKCILCGDCVRACRELQGVGALDFAHRGADSMVLPAFGMPLKDVECVYCGQCVTVCPTGALTPKSEVDAVWRAINDPKKTVVVQFAPAVRVGIGEYFHGEPGRAVTGQVVAALRKLGFDKVYDTLFAADLTVVEEASEFVRRWAAGDHMPQFTSCCPAWVKYAEQGYPELLPHLSSCRSPQGMFGSLAKEALPGLLGVKPEDLVVVSVMPCTAKKFEAKRKELGKGAAADVDHVITTIEFGQMITEAGIDFFGLEPEAADPAMGLGTGAAALFGTTGGVSEAVLRFAAHTVANIPADQVDMTVVRSDEGLRSCTVKLGDKDLRLAIVTGLANVKPVLKEVREGKSPYDLIEVMACPGGCVCGGGQPPAKQPRDKGARTQGLRSEDQRLTYKSSEQNPEVERMYRDAKIGEYGSHRAHELFHTHYHQRRRLADIQMNFSTGAAEGRIPLRVCVGTNCHERGASQLLAKILEYLESSGKTSLFDVKATFCFERCDRGPTVFVAGSAIEFADFEKVRAAMEQALAATAAAT